MQRWWHAGEIMPGLVLALAVVSACSNAEAMPKVGEPAPEFSARDETGQVIRLKDLRGSPVVLYSYPKDDTPGCTLEAKNFSAARPELDALGVVLLGVSGQDAESHKAFKQKLGINFPLLVDPEHKLMEAYGMWNGLLARRTTVLIAPDGRVAAVWPSVDPAQHDQEVLAAVRALLPAKAGGGAQQ